MAFRPESTLNPRALRREGVQLAVVAALSAASLLSSSRPLQIAAGVVDVFALLMTTLAAVVAWRVGGRGVSFGLYAIAAGVFALLAAANFLP